MKILKHFLLAFASIIFLGLSSCNNDNSTTDDKKEAEEHNDAKFNNKSENDAQFLVEAADISLAEVSLGELAGKNATMDDTRELGKMMNRDHKKAYDDLASLASKKTITIPSAMSKASQDEYNSLAEKKGSEFDKKYCDMMVEGHKTAIEKYEKASKEAVDPDIQAYASNTLPVLRGHLDHAMNCQEKCNKMK